MLNREMDNFRSRDIAASVMFPRENPLTLAALFSGELSRKAHTLVCACDKLCEMTECAASVRGLKNAILAFDHAATHAQADTYVSKVIGAKLRYEYNRVVSEWTQVSYDLPRPSADEDW